MSERSFDVWIDYWKWLINKGLEFIDGENPVLYIPTFDSKIKTKGEDVFIGETMVDIKFAYYMPYKTYVNFQGYPTMRFKERWIDIHRVIYYLEHKIWTEENKTAIHHVDGNKFNAISSNLQLRSWNHENYGSLARLKREQRSLEQRNI